MIKLTQMIFDGSEYVLIDMWINPRHVSAITVKNQIDVDRSYVQVSNSGYLVLGSPAEIEEKLRVSG